MHSYRSSLFCNLLNWNFFSFVFLIVIKLWNSNVRMSPWRTRTHLFGRCTGCGRETPLFLKRCSFEKAVSNVLYRIGFFREKSMPGRSWQYASWCPCVLRRSVSFSPLRLREETKYATLEWHESPGNFMSSSSTPNVLLFGVHHLTRVFFFYRKWSDSYVLFVMST